MFLLYFTYKLKIYCQWCSLRDFKKKKKEQQREVNASLEIPVLFFFSDKNNPRNQHHCWFRWYKYDGHLRVTAIQIENHHLLCQK